MKFIQINDINKKITSQSEIKLEEKKSVLKRINVKKLLIITIPLLFLLTILFLLYYLIWGRPINQKEIASEVLTPIYTLIETKINKELKINIFDQIYIKQVEIRDKQNPINGNLLTTVEFEENSKYRPIIVVTDNHEDARPQSGLSDADFVYEFPVEGGITRILAVYWSKYPSSFGPIRSFRTYFGDIVQEYDGLIYHIGQAEINEEELVKNPSLKTYDSSTYFSTNSIARTSCGYYRDQVSLDNKVAIEHTAFSDITKLRACVDKSVYTKKTNVIPLKYRADESLENRSNSSIANINYSANSFNNSNNVKWVYEKVENSYQRLVNSEKQIDRNNTLEIKVKNVIIQEVNIKNDYQAGGRLSLDMVGEGKAKVLMNGKVIEAIWRKDNVKSRTRFYDTANKEIELNRGKTWINVVGSSSYYDVR